MPAPQDTFMRSADMSLTRLCISADVAREVMHALGELGLMDFRDLNHKKNITQRQFTKEILRLETVERQLRFFQSLIERENIKPDPYSESDDDPYPLSASSIDALVNRCTPLEKYIVDRSNAYNQLFSDENRLIEHICALNETSDFFSPVRGQADSSFTRLSEDDSAPLLRDRDQNSRVPQHIDPESQAPASIHFVSGVIPRDRVPSLERILWRTLRGHLYMNQSPISQPIVDPKTGASVEKNVFVVYAANPDLAASIQRIASALGANLYKIDQDEGLRASELDRKNAELSDQRKLRLDTKEALNEKLAEIGKHLNEYMVIVKKEKAVYDALNKLEYDSRSDSRKTLTGEAWCPTNSIPLVQSTLDSVKMPFQTSVPSLLQRISTSETPPTYIKTNRFTLAFQTIIDAYGTSYYGEFNPGLPTIITFPFLFAVMFGDMGHGFIMTLAACAMIYFEKPLSKADVSELVTMAFYGRYIMLMMGIFSLYTGFIYSDIFSRTIPLFTSMWEWPDFSPGDTVDAVRTSGYTYPMGLDWGWHGSENDLLFANSYKMKLSIVLGWFHMTFSLCLAYVNARHLKRPIDIWSYFVPSMLFFQCIFGYLVFTILFKWSVDWYSQNKEPPGLLNMFIYMFLSPGTIETPLYRGQGFVQQLFLLIAVCCVPFMLFLKPAYLYYQNRHRSRGYQGINEGRDRVTDLEDDQSMVERTDEEHGDAENADSDDKDKFDLSEQLIYSVIHTTEFCLNCVSHTASYLRLWALSLAHQQLSIVLWNMTLGISLSMTGAMGTFAAVFLFGLWFILTVCILCAMEGTSAMLHSLRLHWVEAMSKHIVGDGIPFQPFSFVALLEGGASD